MDTRIVKYHEAIDSNSKSLREWGLLHLAATYQYGWFDTPIDYDIAIRYYDWLLLDCDNEEYIRNAHSRRYDALMKQGEYGRAYEDVCHILYASKNTEETEAALKRLSSFLFDMPVDFDFEGIDILQIEEAVDALDPAGVQKKRFADVYYRLGRKAMLSYRPADALRMHEKALAWDDPETNPWANFEIGRMYINPKGNRRRLKHNAKLAKEYLCRIPDDAPKELLSLVYDDLAWIEFCGSTVLLPTNIKKALEYCDKSIECKDSDGWAARMKSTIIDYQNKKISDGAKNILSDAYLDFLQSL